MIQSPAIFRRSFGIPSGPAALPFLRLFRAFLTSASVISLFRALKLYSSAASVVSWRSQSLSSVSVAPLSTALKWLNHVTPSILLLGGLRLYFLISYQNACGSCRAENR